LDLFPEARFILNATITALKLCVLWDNLFPKVGIVNGNATLGISRNEARFGEGGSSSGY